MGLRFPEISLPVNIWSSLEVSLVPMAVGVARWPVNSPVMLRSQCLTWNQLPSGPEVSCGQPFFLGSSQLRGTAESWYWGPEYSFGSRLFSVVPHPHLCTSGHKPSNAWGTEMMKQFFSPFPENPCIYHEWVFVWPCGAGNTSIERCHHERCRPCSPGLVSHNPESWFQVGFLSRSLSYYKGPSPSL